MATSKAKLRKHQAAVSKVALMLISEQVPECQALYAAAESIAQLIAEHCPIAQPAMRRAKKVSVKK